MAKIDFERTPDGSQRIVDGNLKVDKAFFLPDYTGEDLSINNNPDEPGAIAYQDASVWVYDGSTWSMVGGLPSGGTSAKYLRGDLTWQTLNTDQVPEVTNLYYTAARFNAAFSSKSTSDLSEGSNLYYTAARFNSAFAAKNTDGLTEGSTNQYYTLARFNSAFAGKTTDDLTQGTINKYYANSLVQSFSDARYLQLSGGTLTGDLQQATLPVNATSVINRGYVDNLITGITWKQEVRAATTANITLSGTQTIDGVAVVANDRVLVKSQTSAIDNGIYIVASGSWSRALDADTSSEIGSATVLVRNGTTLKNTQWTCTNSTDPVINTDNITFGQISGAGTYTNGTGISLSSNVFSLDLTYTDARYIQSAALTPYALVAGQAFTGAITAPSVGISGTGGAGILSMIAQTSVPSTPAVGSQIIYADASGRFTIMGSNGFSASFSKSLLTASRVYTLPDAAGTIALQSTTLAGYGILDAYSSSNPSGYISGNQTITLSGDVTGSGSTAIATAIGAGVVTNTMLAGSIGNAKLSNSTISGVSLGGSLFNLSATNATLTFSASYNGSAAATVGLNLGNANNWTAVQNFGPSVVGSGGVAIGTTINPTLTGGANNDILTGLYINPTLASGGFTGIVSTPLKMRWSTTGSTQTDFSISNVIGDGVVTLHASLVPSASNFFFRCDNVNVVLNAPNAAGTVAIRGNNSTYMQMYSTGRFGMQNAGTYTDDGIHRLQLSGGITTGAATTSASATWINNTSTSLVGVNFNAASVTYTDGLTAASTTITYAGANVFNAPVFTTTTNTGVIYTNASTVTITGAPTATGGASITNPYALHVTAGATLLSGNASVGGTFGVTGTTTFTGNVSTFTTGSQGNFFTHGTDIGVLNNNNSALIFGGASNISARTLFNGTTSTQITAGNSYAGLIVGAMPVTMAATGTTTWAVGMVINGLVNSAGTSVITNAAPITITNTAALFVGATSTAGTNNYGIYCLGNIFSNTTIRLKGYTVSTLPTGVQGDLAYVTDALAPSYGVALAGGGAVITKAFHNGTNWIAG